MYEILTKTSLGIQFVVAFKARGKFLKNNQKSKLVRIVLANEFDAQYINHKDNDGLLEFFRFFLQTVTLHKIFLLCLFLFLHYIYCRINKKKFINIAEEIALNFPGENQEFYYKPAAAFNGKIYEQASGKIWDHFKYKKQVLKKEGVLLDKKKSKINVINAVQENHGKFYEYY